MDLRLVVPALCGWTAAATIVAVPAASWPVVLVAAGAATGSLLAAAALRRARGALALVAVVSLAVGFVAVSVGLQHARRHPDPPGEHTLVDVRARLESPFETLADGRHRVRMTVTRIEAAGTVRRVEATSLAYCSPPDAHTDRARPGATLALHGRIVATDAADATAFLFFCRGPPRLIEPAHGLVVWANGLRTAFARACARLPGAGGDLLPGLSIGDVSAVGTDLDHDMKTSSLSHLTAVSGANCAVVVTLVMMLAALAGAGRVTRAVVASAALGCFVVLVTPGPSIERASVMAAVAILARVTGRPSRGLPALAAATLALVGADPWIARDYGFMLSVLATGGLLVLSGRLTRMLARVMPRRLAALLAVPAAAQLACGPVLVLLSPTLPLYAVPANVLAEFAAPTATILGFAACLVLPLSSGVGFAIAQLAWLPSAWVARVAHVTAGLPGARLPWLGGLSGLTLVALLTVCALVAMFGPRRPVVVMTASAVLVAAGGAYLGATGGAGLVSTLSRPRDWMIAMCDVGQADAILVRDGGATALIDVGREPGPVTSCLSRLGVGAIDLLVLTHYDADHVGGLDAVAGRVRHAIVGHPDGARASQAIDELEHGGAEVRIGRAGDHGRLGSLSWRVLWPRDDHPSLLTGNAGSVTLLVTGRGIRSVFLGDLDAQAQDALLETGGIGPVDVVKVAHHGSADQSARFYAELSARLGLISVGADNDYGHPTRRTLTMLADDGTAVARTDLRGTVLVTPRSDGTLEVWSRRAAPAGSAVASMLESSTREDRGGTQDHVGDEVGHPDPAVARGAPRPRRARLRPRDGAGRARARDPP